MAITLQPKERDAIVNQISADFTPFGDLENAIEEGNEEQCYILGRILSDGLRLLLDGGLGWRSHTGEPTVLTIPDEEMIAIMGRLRERMVGLYESSVRLAKAHRRNGMRSPRSATAPARP